MSAENRVLALQLALSPVAPESGGLTLEQATTVAAAAGLFYRFLEGAPEAQPTPAPAP